MSTSTIAHVTSTAPLYWDTSSKHVFFTKDGRQTMVYFSSQWALGPEKGLSAQSGIARRKEHGQHTPTTYCIVPCTPTVSFLAHPRAFLACMSTVLLKPVFWTNHWLFEWLPRSPAPLAQPAEITNVPLANLHSFTFPNQPDKEDTSNTPVQSKDHVKRAVKQQRLLTLNRGHSWLHSSKAKGMVCLTVTKSKSFMKH